jgi:hypothetical protein
VATDVVDYAYMDTGAERPDFKAIKAHGVRVVWIRKQVCYFDAKHQAWVIAADPCWERDSAAARAAGLIVGTYVFPGIGPGAPTPADQVAAAHAHGPPLIPGLDLPIGLDIEFPGNGIIETRMKQRDVGMVIESFVDEITTAFGCAPFAYTSHVQTFDSNGLGGVLAKSAALAKCHLWQKTPYRLGPHNPPDHVAAMPPHLDTVAWDEHDYWRIPAPWTFHWLTQTQGDARAFPGILQCDLGSWNMLYPSKVTDPRWQWIGEKLGWDFVFTPDALKAAFSAWQRDEGLVADGICGPASFVKLAWLKPRSTQC